MPSPGTTPATLAGYTLPITGEALSRPRRSPHKHFPTMTTTTLRAALARLQALPWADYATRTAAGFRACWVAAQLITAGLALLVAIAYEHRQQIRAAGVAAIAAVVVAGQATYHAGRYTRRLWSRLLAFSERMGCWYAALLLGSPAVAPAAPAAPEPVALARLSNRELRQLLGIRKHLPKRQLLALAMAV